MLDKATLVTPEMSCWNMDSTQRTYIQQATLPHTISKAPLGLPSCKAPGAQVKSRHCCQSANKRAALTHQACCATIFMSENSEFHARRKYAQEAPLLNTASQ